MPAINIFLKRQDFGNINQGFELELDMETGSVLSVKEAEISGACNGAGEQFSMLVPFSSKSFAAYFLIDNETYISIDKDLYKLNETKFLIISEPSFLPFFWIKVKGMKLSKWYFGLHPSMKFEMHSSIIDILRLVIKNKISNSELSKKFVTAESR